MTLPKRTALFPALVALVALVGVATLVAALIYGYLRMSKERTADAEGDKPVVAESRVEHRTNGEVVVNLDLSAQKLIGLQTTAMTAATQALAVKAYGRVLELAPLLVLVSDTASARAALEATSMEYQRLKGLFAQGQNASAKALESAQAAMKHDQIALQGAETQLMATWGKSVANETNLAAFVESLAKLECVLVRLDLPAGDSLPEGPVGARLLVPGTSEALEARFLGRATTTDPQVQGAGFLFVATNAAARLAPGLALTGFLELPGVPLHGVVVPNAAIVRAADRAWVYVQTGDTTFQRRELALDRPVAEGWFVTKDLAPNDRLVVTGAQTLLSEERKTQIKIGD
jgi:hypothetical protein